MLLGRLGFGRIGVVGLLLGLVRFDGIGAGQDNREIGTDLRRVVLGQGDLVVRLVTIVPDGDVVVLAVARRVDIFALNGSRPRCLNSTEPFSFSGDRASKPSAVVTIKAIAIIIMVPNIMNSIAACPLAEPLPKRIFPAP